MCGIIGVVRLSRTRLNQPLGQILRHSLEKLEYRGYDSVGVACLWDNELIIRKGKGRIADVGVAQGFDRLDGEVGMGHTRWATHGKPSDANAHPHRDCRGRVAVVHNGIISNYAALKRELAARGHSFSSETDTEVFAHLIEEKLAAGYSGYQAFKSALMNVLGSYSFLAIMLQEPDKIFFARRNSPLVLGIAADALFVASDIPAFLEYTDRVVPLSDGEVGYIALDGSVVLEDLMLGRRVDLSSRVRKIGWTPELARKGGYPHYMIKEIHEQPNTLVDTVKSFLDDGSYQRGAELIFSSNRVFLVAAGTAHHASLAARDALLKLVGMVSYPIISSEYALHGLGVEEGDCVIAVSQSGETIDTLLALREFKRRGAKVVALTNVMDSAIARESDMQLYTRAGPEIGVAATKTFTAQVASLVFLAAKLGVMSGKLGGDEYKEFIKHLEGAPELVDRNINVSEPSAKELARILRDKSSMYCLSRGMGVPLAREGALKIKEVSYIHCEAYEAGESKHGPISLVSNMFPVVFVASDTSTFDQLSSNLMEMKSRGAYTVGIMPSGGDPDITGFDYTFRLASSQPLINTILFAPTLQLLAYYLAVIRGYDPDKPRNLAKTVTVE
ncbi:MAG: glutamine--fructose-6-phosphate transaminase (isomerizing) [Thermoprotei archaeon]